MNECAWIEIQYNYSKKCQSTHEMEWTIFLTFRSKTAVICILPHIVLDCSKFFVCEFNESVNPRLFSVLNDAVMA